MSRSKAIGELVAPRWVGPLLASILLLALAACGNGDPAVHGAAPADASGNTADPTPRTGDEGASHEGATGTLSFELRTVGGLTLDTFDYAITGPDFSKSGVINARNSTTVAARIDGIPAANAYSVTLTGNSVGTPKAQCSGSASFNVQARSVTSVTVAIGCHEADAVVTPPDTEPRPAPLAPFVTWLSGLALLALGSRFAGQRSRAETAV